MYKVQRKYSRMSNVNQATWTVYLMYICSAVVPNWSISCALYVMWHYHAAWLVKTSNWGINWLQQHTGQLILICVLGYWFWKNGIIWYCVVSLAISVSICMHAKFHQNARSSFGRWWHIMFWQLWSNCYIGWPANVLRSSQFPHYPFWHACNFLRVKTNLPITA